MTDPITKWDHLAPAQTPSEPLGQAEQSLKGYCSKQTQHCGAALVLRRRASVGAGLYDGAADWGWMGLLVWMECICVSEHTSWQIDKACTLTPPASIFWVMTPESAAPCCGWRVASPMYTSHYCSQPPVMQKSLNWAVILNRDFLWRPQTLRQIKRRAVAGRGWKRRLSHTPLRYTSPSQLFVLAFG